MSISGTLSSALSGLNAASRAAEVVANNIANAATPGYARRELQLSARTVGSASQGVEATGVLRITDRALLSDRRVAEAGAAGHGTRADFLQKVETALGDPTDAASLGGRVGTLETALIAAASHPESEARLAEVLSASKALVSQIGSTGGTIQQARVQADRAIANDVQALNRTLAQIAEMNAQIRDESWAGRDASTLMDQRQALVDTVASILPIRETQRQNGQIALSTPGGAVLVEGKASVFGFSPAGVITPDMTIESGGLSGLTLNGKPVVLGAASPIAGGRLAANFAVRDELAPAAQEKLDAVARDLIERFADPALDPTLAAGQAGLFTDAGGLVDPALERGVAQRLSVNAAVDPARGGALWRLRDGIGAASPGRVGNSALLQALDGALTADRSPVSGGFMAGGRSFSALAADLLSGVSTARLTADGEESFAAAKTDALRQQELEMGVDTDAEMQQLLLVEQAFAANARVVKAVDEMVQLLLGM